MLKQRARAALPIPIKSPPLYCIDPNGGDQPEFGKIDAKQKASAFA
jgi:hypothetical protein